MYRRRTIINASLLMVSMVGLWAGSVYVPSSVTQLAAKSGFSDLQGARMASYGTMILSVGTILGCLVTPMLAERYGRRLTLGLFFLLMFASIALGFGYFFYFEKNALPWFMACLFFLGVGGANFAMYTLWLPEQYPTTSRASGIAFVSSVGRFAGVAMVFLVGAGIRSYGSLGIPVAITALAFVVGILLLPFAEETRGKPLPV